MTRWPNERLEVSNADYSIGDAVPAWEAMTSGVKKPVSIQPRFNLTTQRVALSGNQPPRSSMCNIATEQRLCKKC